jgi:hypothetical protein
MTAPTGRQATAADISAVVVLAQSAAPLALTGSTSEASLATISISANAMGTNGRLRIKTKWTVTGSTNAKTPRVRLGGLAGTIFWSRAETTAANITIDNVTTIENRNSASSQIGGRLGDAAGSGSSSAAFATGALDTTQVQSLVISGQLASSVENMTLESYIVELIPG